MNILWIPIFSMRSYDTGEYSILKDGNFQLTMARVLASDFDLVTVAVPEQSSDFEEVLLRFKDANVYFTKMKYGLNAVQTREIFWVQNQIPSAYDLVISDITGYTGDSQVIYNFNITKLPELDRPYIDRFFEQDLKSIEQSVFTTVLNPRQREYILEVRPDLESKIVVHTKCVHSAMMPSSAPMDFMMDADPKVVFWPFRISDKAYGFSEFLQAFTNQGLQDLGYGIVITDPNDSATELPPFVSKIKPSKTEYYEILSSQPTVVMLDDIDTVLHPGTIEFFFYGCPVITFESKLIQNPNAIGDLGNLQDALSKLSYNSINLLPFVYNLSDVDPLYNQDFIHDKTKN